MIRPKVKSRLQLNDDTVPLLFLAGAFSRQPRSAVRYHVLQEGHPENAEAALHLRRTSAKADRGRTGQGKNRATLFRFASLISIFPTRVEG